MFDFLKKKETPQTPPPKPAISIGPAPQQTQPKNEGRDLNIVVEDLEKKVERLEDALNVVKESVKSVNGKLEEMEKTMSQLASIYEIVMNQLNPFLDEEEKALPLRKEKMEERVQEVEEKPVVVEVEKKETKESQEETVLSYVDLTNPKVIEVLMDWARFMVEKVGHSGIEELLRYYVEIRWISEEVADVLKRYAEGIRVDLEPEMVNVQLDPEEHNRVLEYILSIKDIMSR